jgi:hypothetical protein
VTVFRSQIIKLARQLSNNLPQLRRRPRLSLLPLPLAIASVNITTPFKSIILRLFLSLAIPPIVNMDTLIGSL